MADRECLEVVDVGWFGQVSAATAAATAQWRKELQGRRLKRYATGVAFVRHGIHGCNEGLAQRSCRDQFCQRR